MRRYSQIDPLEFRAILWASPALREARYHNDPDIIAQLILEAMNEALDATAPMIRVQIKTNFIDYMTEPTRVLRQERDRLQRVAHQTNSQDDWRDFRAARNIAKSSLKSDKRKYFTDKLTSGNSP